MATPSRMLLTQQQVCHACFTMPCMLYYACLKDVFPWADHKPAIAYWGAHDCWTTDSSGFMLQTHHAYGWPAVTQMCCIWKDRTCCVQLRLGMIRTNTLPCHKMISLANAGCNRKNCHTCVHSLGRNVSDTISLHVVMLDLTLPPLPVSPSLPVWAASYHFLMPLPF